MLFSPAHVKATLSPAVQSAISTGEIIVLGSLIEAASASIDLLSGTAAINVNRLLSIAVLSFLLAVMKGVATFMTAKGSPLASALGLKLLSLEEVLRLRAFPTQATNPTPSTFHTSSDLDVH